jgi:hypothetical protein
VADKGEPWYAPNRLIEALLSEKEVYVVNRLNRRQIRAIAETLGLMSLLDSYVIMQDDGQNRGKGERKATHWLEEIVFRFLMLSKANDGWAVRVARDVARGQATRMMFNISRWRRVFFGSEDEGGV